jgi:hypothetical protein
MSLQMQRQRGSALISVMIILLLTTVLGVIAVRQGSTNLNLAMNASVQSLLVQSSDVGLDKLESSNIAGSASGAGPLGYLRLSGNEGKEYVFCYRPTNPSNNIYNIKDDVILLPEGGTEGDAEGFCGTQKDQSYSSNRRVVISQMALVRPQEAAVAEPFQYFEKGTDSETVKRPEQQRFRAYITSIAPTLARVDKEKIDQCFELANDDSTVVSRADLESMSNCFFRLGVPSNTQVQDYVLGGLVSVQKF